MRAIPVVLLCLWCSLGVFEKAGACTIFYCSRDGTILAGNNEDWKDPFTKMCIYPPSGSNHGWIKFGFGSGFPQGGMNDQGLFWDATAGPHKDMPYSEATKTLYEGALMQKVIEESADVTEAKAILQDFYCQDQYRAQYLIGDALGSSMIAEGDSFIMKEHFYQVLTNFYQSDPDLGGYPCWRYQTSTELLADCDAVTPYFMGTVLASTHQEGKYPTQYSNIYDLKNKTIYLFYYHNYEEVLAIDLLKEIKRGAQSYDIPSLFSQVRLLGPGDEEILAGKDATITWKGLQGSTYRIIYAQDPHFTDPLYEEVLLVAGSQKNSASLTYLLPLLFMVLLASSRRVRGGRVLFMCLFLVTGTQCNKDDPEDQEIPVEQSATLHHLDPDTTYYWKLEATSNNSASFATETIVRTFKTGSP